MMDAGRRLMTGMVIHTMKMKMSVIYIGKNSNPSMTFLDTGNLTTESKMELWTCIMEANFIVVGVGMAAITLIKVDMQITNLARITSHFN